MSLIKKEDMATLYPAAQSRTTSAGAAVEQNRMTVAYAINSAANTGLYSAAVSSPILPEVLQELEEKGYLVQNSGYAKDSDLHLISWDEY